MAKRGRPKSVTSDKKYYQPKDPNFNNIQNSIKVEKLMKAYAQIAENAGIELSWSYNKRLKEHLKDYILL